MNRGAPPWSTVGAAFSAVRILIPSLKLIGWGTLLRFRAVHVSQELPPSSPQKEELEFRKKGSQAPERNQPGQSLISDPELQRHIRRQVIYGKGHQRARKHSEEATDK
jgi:hypothetical protein